MDTGKPTADSSSPFLDKLLSEIAQPQAHQMPAVLSVIRDDHLSPAIPAIMNTAQYPDRSSSPFLNKLPPEIKNTIYRLVLVDPNSPLTVAKHDFSPRKTLIDTCKQIRSEAKDIILAENTFAVVCGKGEGFIVARWLASLGDRARLIKRLSIAFEVSEETKERHRSTVHHRRTSRDHGVNMNSPEFEIQWRGLLASMFLTWLPECVAFVKAAHISATLGQLQLGAVHVEKHELPARSSVEKNLLYVMSFMSIGTPWSKPGRVSPLASPVPANPTTPTSTSTSSSTATTSPLLDKLPPELRNQIHCLVLIADDELVDVNIRDLYTRTAILRTCSQIRNEAKDLISENDFLIACGCGDGEHAGRWLKSLGDDVRSLKLVLVGFESFFDMRELCGQALKCKRFEDMEDSEYEELLLYDPDSWIPHAPEILRICADTLVREVKGLSKIMSEMVRDGRLSKNQIRTWDPKGRALTTYGWNMTDGLREFMRRWFKGLGTDKGDRMRASLAKNPASQIRLPMDQVSASEG